MLRFELRCKLNTPLDDEIQQSTSLQWLAEFLGFAQEVMVPFTPRFIPAILPNLAHHVPMIQSAAIRTNKLLTKVIQDLPSPVEIPSWQSSSRPPAGSPTPTATAIPSRQPTISVSPGGDANPPPEAPPDGQLLPSTSDKTTIPLPQRARTGTSQPSTSDAPSRPQSRMSSNSLIAAPSATAAAPPSPVEEEDQDLFDYQATVNELTIQFLSEHEQTRVAALKWLIMLHHKAPKRVLIHITSRRLKG